MSTGSDRASPTGSLSLSPTNSMASFFPDQTSPTFSQGFTFPTSQHSPPTSPINLSPVATPPPGDEARLPIFNQLSSTLEAFKHMSLWAEEGFGEKVRNFFAYSLVWRYIIVCTNYSYRASPNILLRSRLNGFQIMLFFFIFIIFYKYFFFLQ